MAADLFGKRLPETALGRKIQLSRSGGRVVHEQLLRDPDPRVLEFLLEGALLDFECEVHCSLRSRYRSCLPVATAARTKPVRSRSACGGKSSNGISATPGPIETNRLVEIKEGS